jgi:hypothetical protein
MNNDIKELIPCPFCGSEISVDIRSVFPITAFLCDGCGACVTFQGTEWDLEKCFMKWNTRAGESAHSCGQTKKGDRDEDI